MKTLNLIFFCLVALLTINCAGNREPMSGPVSVEFNGTVNSLSDAIKSIELIPLENDDEHLLGTMVELIVTDDAYIVIDGQNGAIFRYSVDGRFINSIGRRGNGPEEYVHINDVQYKDSSLYVFSIPSKIQRFSLDGTMLDMITMDEPGLGVMSWITSEGVLTYYGYGSGRESRFALLSDDSPKEFYPSDEKVINLTPAAQIFSAVDDSVFVVDSYSNIIKIYSEGEMSDGPSFDFGKYSIPKSFYEYDDAFSAMESLMNGEFAMIGRYMCDDNKRLVIINVQKQMDVYSHCGFYSKDKWIWFGTGKVGADVFANSFNQIKDGALYCLLDPSLIDTFPSSLRKLILNPEILERAGEDDNYIVAKLILI